MIVCCLAVAVASLDSSVRYPQTTAIKAQPWADLIEIDPVTKQVILIGSGGMWYLSGASLAGSIVLAPYDLRWEPGGNRAVVLGEGECALLHRQNNTFEKKGLPRTLTAWWRKGSLYELRAIGGNASYAPDPRSDRFAVFQDGKKRWSLPKAYSPLACSDSGTYWLCRWDKSGKSPSRAPHYLFRFTGNRLRPVRMLPSRLDSDDVPPNKAQWLGSNELLLSVCLNQSQVQSGVLAKTVGSSRARTLGDALLSRIPPAKIALFGSGTSRSELSRSLRVTGTVANTKGGSIFAILGGSRPSTSYLVGAFSKGWTVVAIPGFAQALAVRDNELFVLTIHGLVSRYKVSDLFARKL